MMKIIDRCIEDPSFTKGREKARKDTWINIGQSAKLSSDFIIKKYKDSVANADSKKTDPDKSVKQKKLFSLAKKGA